MLHNDTTPKTVRNSQKSIQHRAKQDTLKPREFHQTESPKFSKPDVEHATRVLQEMKLYEGYDIFQNIVVNASMPASINS